MLKWLDHSKLLSGIVDWFSNFLARQRGLPVIVGIVLVGISLVIQSAAVYADTRFLELIGVIVQHAGVLIALIGLLLAAPLGR